MESWNAELWCFINNCQPCHSQNAGEASSDPAADASLPEALRPPVGVRLWQRLPAPEGSGSYDGWRELHQGKGVLPHLNPPVKSIAWGPLSDPRGEGGQPRATSENDAGGQSTLLATATASGSVHLWSCAGVMMKGGRNQPESVALPEEDEGLPRQSKPLLAWQELWNVSPTEAAGAKAAAVAVSPDGGMVRPNMMGSMAPWLLGYRATGIQQVLIDCAHGYY